MITGEVYLFQSSDNRGQSFKFNSLSQMERILKKIKYEHAHFELQVKFYMEED